MIKNLIWDLDGTLFDTYPGITYAISKSLNALDATVALNVIDGLARQSIEHCLGTLAGRFRLDLDLLRATFIESYRTVDPANQLPYPGVGAVCALVQAREGRNVIVTHRGLRSTEGLLETHGLLAYFDGVFSVEQGYPRKPDPAMMLAALQQHALHPAETLCIGDRAIDLQAGRAAGLRTCSFCNPDLAPLADFRISAYNQLLDLLAAGQAPDSTG